MRALRVVVAAAEEEAASAALWEAGTSGLEVRGAGDGRVELIAYFPGPVDEGVISKALHGARVEEIPVPQVDWVARFKEGFRAFHAGGFRIVPAWEAVEPGRDVLRVDPGRAFGTGTHETTRLCLGAIEDLARRGRLGRTLDLGCGTGLLAIAAGRLGAGPVVAADIDRDAIAGAREHAQLNAARMALVRADGGSGFRAGAFDLVLANLMAPLLVERSAEIRRLLAPGATLVLSGLLLDDVGEVAAAFSACGRPVERRDGEWAALVFELPPGAAAPS